MIKWIEKNINPPGTANKNRFALFSAIGGIADTVRADALKAFNAHFPYLADSVKLEEHGNALLVPRLLDDTEKEYRDRVATASFFLTRSGERAYILEQLDAHFGGRYTVTDEFLDVYVKVRDLGVADRRWLLQFLDGLINPNVRLSVAEWFHFLDKAAAREKLAMRTEMNPRDTFNDRSVKLNGRVKLDGRTENSAVKFKPKLDGRFRADGGINLSGALLSEPAAGAARVPARLGRGILDRPGMAVKPGHLDGCGGVDVRFAMRPQMAVFTAFPGVLETARIKVKTGPADCCSGVLAKLSIAARTGRLDGCGGVGIRFAMRPQMGVFTAFPGVLETARIKVKTGPADCYGGVLAKLSIAARTGHLDGCTAGDRLNAGMRYCRRLGGRYRLDGSIKLNSGILYAAQEDL